MDFLIVWKQLTTTSSGSQHRTVRCEKCRAEYHYLLHRTARGEGSSFFFLDNAGAARRSADRAAAKLRRSLDKAVDPVPCPACGHFQKDMVAEARRRHLPWMSPHATALILIGYVFLGFVALILNGVLAREGPLLPWPVFYPALGALGGIILLLPPVRCVLALGYDPNRDSPEKRIRKGYGGGVLAGQAAKARASFPAFGAGGEGKAGSPFIRCQECGQEYLDRSTRESPAGRGVAPCPKCGRIQDGMVPAGRGQRGETLILLGILALCAAALYFPVAMSAHADVFRAGAEGQARSTRSWLIDGGLALAGVVCFAAAWLRVRTYNPNKASREDRLKLASQVSVAKEALAANESAKANDSTG